MASDESVKIGVPFVGGASAGAAVVSRCTEMSIGRGGLYGVSFALVDLAAAIVGSLALGAKDGWLNQKIFGDRDMTHTESFATRAVCQVAGGAALFGVFKVFQRAITWQQAALFIGAQVAMNALSMAIVSRK